MKTLPLNKKKSISNMTFKGYGIELRPVTHADLFVLQQWRNSQQISQMMVDNSYITSRQQQLWYQKIKERFDQAHWVVWCEGVRAGYVTIKGKGPLEHQKQLTGGMYSGNLQNKHKLLVQNKHKLLGYAMQIMMLDIVFEHLSVSKYRGPVQKKNAGVRKLLKQLGFREEGFKGDFVWTSIVPTDFKTSRIKFERYFPDTRCELIG